jgi:hypothetical protein
MNMKSFLVFTALIVIVSAVNIECEFGMKVWYVEFGKLYTCIVKSITLTGSKSLEIVTGDHKSGKSNADVKQIWFGWEYPCYGLDFIPQDIHKHFPNIIGITFWECNIKSLTGDELKDYVNLEWFTICDNPIDKIPGSLFNHNPKIKHVSFFNSNITKVGSNLLTGLDHLTTADFGKNSCIDKRVTQNRAKILEFIEDLKRQCAYPDDPSIATTDRRTINSNIFKNLTAENVRIRIELQDLKEDLAKVKERVKDLEQNKKNLDEIIQNLQDRLASLEAKKIY